MLRLGLCCLFVDEPIRFRTTTAKVTLDMPREAALQKLSLLIRANVEALRQAITFCADHGIGAFRINSGILPIKTHPQAGYEVSELPGGDELVRGFRRCGALAAERDIRLLFHPDQFVVLNSPNPDVVRRSVEELNYQAEVAEWIGADVINVHAGGVYGDRPAALQRLARTLRKLPPPIRSRLTLENDDRSYRPADLLPLCLAEGIPLIYDAHHHRCLPDGEDVETTTHRAMATWNREPVFHVSSSRDGWSSARPGPHADYLHPRDLPACWLSLDATVEIEAKAKEKAVNRLRRHLERKHPGCMMAGRSGASATSTPR